MTTRIFLVAPEAIPAPALLTCAKAAAAAGDCASILLQTETDPATIAALQALNLAVILQDVSAEEVLRKNADGLLLSDSSKLASLRKQLPDQSLGVLAGKSRHEAMEAAEAGADFVCFTPSKQVAGEPIIGWWQDVTDVPSVAFEPLTLEAIATIRPQRPDFIRPLDNMWLNAEEARRTVETLMAAWAT